MGTEVDAALRVGDGGAGVEAERAGGRVGVSRVISRAAPALAAMVGVEIADKSREGRPGLDETKGRREERGEEKRRRGVGKKQRRNGENKREGSGEAKERSRPKEDMKEKRDRKRYVRAGTRDAEE